MSCISPIGFRIKNKFGYTQNIEVPCGHCLNCMIKKQSQIEFLAKKELLENYKKGLSASFVTLTYDDNHIPLNNEGFVTLRREDVQKFLKRLRRNMEYHNTKKPFKVLYCGEYGDGSHSTSKSGVSTCRPHYHLVFIGLSPEEVKYYTRKLWRFGLCDIGPLGAGGIRYLCKYMTKAIPDKDVKLLRSVAGVQNPFFYHSVGLGKEWIDKHLDTIVENNFCFNVNGKITPYPKYVCVYVMKHTGTNYVNSIRTFLSENVLPVAKGSGMNFKEFTIENSIISYKYKVAALRSQGKPVNDITLSKKWVKPISHVDRSIRELVNKIEFTPIEQTFGFNQINRIIPRNKNGSVNWDLYLYGDVVPF